MDQEVLEKDVRAWLPELSAAELEGLCNHFQLNVIAASKGKKKELFRLVMQTVFQRETTDEDGGLVFYQELYDYLDQEDNAKVVSKKTTPVDTKVKNNISPWTKFI